MENETIIPQSSYESWELEAMKQNIPYTELGNFIKMKETRYLERFGEKPCGQKVFANTSRTKLTDYGAKVVVDELQKLSPVERCCKLLKITFEDLQKKLLQGFSDVEKKETFLAERDFWFARLKEKMKDLRISKETLSVYGLDWNSCKSFYYQAI